MKSETRHLQIRFLLKYVYITYNPRSKTMSSVIFKYPWMLQQLSEVIWGIKYCVIKWKFQYYDSVYIIIVWKQFISASLLKWLKCEDWLRLLIQIIQCIFHNVLHSSHFLNNSRRLLFFVCSAWNIYLFI